MSEHHLIKYLAPSWFAVIMGTGGLGNILYIWQDSFFAGRILGMGLAALADIFFFLVLIPWIIRWFFYYEYVLRDLHHPITVNFFVTMPVATTIVGTNIFIIWSSYLSELLVYRLTFLTWIVAIAGVVIFTFYTTFRMMRMEVCPNPETMNFSWIMAPIANMAVLLIGNPVLTQTISLYPKWALSVLILNTALLGIGFFLFIFISAIIFVRLAQYSLPPAEMTPSFGIFLSAVGLAVSAIIDTSINTKLMGMLPSVDLSYLGAAVIWGFGIWIIGIIILISIHQIRQGGIPFSLGWWAFIFPLAAYTIASLKIGVYFQTSLTFYYNICLTSILALLWLYTFSNTVIGMITGNLFRGNPISPKSVNSNLYTPSKQ